MNSMFSITGQVVNTFEAPGRAANEKAGTEAQEAKPKVQILGEMPVPGGQKRVELVTLTCEDQTVYDALRGQTVSVPLGIFAPAKGQIIYFIPKGSVPVVVGESAPAATPPAPRSAVVFPSGLQVGKSGVSASSGGA
jgi:hypothetical protein